MNDTSQDSRSPAPARRLTTRWQPGGPTVRFHIELEAVEDLTADLERGFAALAAAAAGV
jgi:cystathionine beta-lyase